jgi:hypothetical protein
VLNTGFLAAGSTPDLRIPESYQANAGVERDLGRGFVVEANYTVNRGITSGASSTLTLSVCPQGFATFRIIWPLATSQTFASGRPDLRPLYNAAGAAS